MALNTKVGGVFQQKFNSVFLLKDNRNERLTVSPKTRAGLHFFGSANDGSRVNDLRSMA